MESGARTGKLKGLQVARFLAALGVVTAHAATYQLIMERAPFVPLTQAGVIGVDVFFILSGFVISRSTLFVARKPEAGTFFRRRWLRIAPLYFILSIPALLIGMDWASPLPWSVISTVTFWLPSPLGLASPLLPVGWTLCFEMLFYVGVAIILATRRPRTAAVALGAVFLAASVAFVLTRSSTAAVLGSPLILEFLAGVLIARWNPAPDAAQGLFLAALGGLIFAFLYAGLCRGGLGVVADAAKLTDWRFQWLRALSFGPIAVLIVIGMLRAEPLMGAAWLAPFVYLGDASYSLYLAHLMIVQVFERLWPLWLPAGIFAPLIIVVSIAAGIITYELIEKPILRALSRPGRRVAVA